MELLLTVSDVRGTQIAATQSAAETRDGFLADLDMVGPITSPEKAQEAAEAIKASTAFLRQIEISRKEVKAPVLELGERIDSVAKELSTQLKAKADAVNNALASYQLEQRRIAEEEKRKAWEREEAIRIEAAAKQREAEEKARKEAEELARKASVARSEETRARYEEQARIAKEKADAEAAKVAEATVAAIVENRVAVPVAPKLDGMAFGTKIEYEVYDIQALYEALPSVVILKESPSALMVALKQLTGEAQLPGVRSWKVAKGKVR